MQKKGEEVAFPDPASLRSLLLLREKESTPVRPAASIIRRHERLTRKPHQLCSVQKYNQSLASTSRESHARGRVLASFCLRAVPVTWLNRHAFEVATAFRGEEKFSPRGNPLWYKNKHWVGNFPIFFFFNVSEVTWVLAVCRVRTPADARS